MFALLSRLMGTAAPPKFGGVTVPHVEGAWARDWILEDGEWDDAGVWDDDAEWNDGEE